MFDQPYYSTWDLKLLAKLLYSIHSIHSTFLVKSFSQLNDPQEFNCPTKNFLLCCVNEFLNIFYSFSAYLGIGVPYMLSSRWVFNNKLQHFTVNIFSAFFLRVQLCPAPASHSRHVLTDALHTSLQG